MSRPWAAALLVAVVSGAYMAFRYKDWFGSWGETSRSLEDTTVLTLPLLAGLAAWRGSAARRGRYAWLLDGSSRHPVMLHARSALELVLFAAVGFAPVAVGAVLATAGEANFGSFPVVTILPVLAGFAAAVALGLLSSSFLPPVVSPIAAVVVVYGLLVVLDTGNPQLRVFAGFVISDPRERTFLIADPLFLLVKTLWLLTIAWLLVEIAVRCSTRWLVPFSLGCLLAVPLILVADSGIGRNDAASVVECQADSRLVGLEVCLTAARSHVRDDLLDAVRPVVELLDGVQGERWSLVEEGASPEPFPVSADNTLTVPFGVVADNNGNAHVVDADLTAAAFVGRLLGGCPSSGVDDRGRPEATAQDVIQGWVLDQIGVPADGSLGYQVPDLSDDVLDYSAVEEFRDEFVGFTAPQRRQWLQENAQGILSCEVTSAHRAGQDES